MPPTSIPITDATRAGANQAAQVNSDNTNGNSLPYNDGKVILELSAVTATTTFSFPIPGAVDGQTVPARTVAVTTAQPRIVGPFPPAIFNQPDGTLLINSDSANGRIRVYHLP